MNTEKPVDSLEQAIIKARARLLRMHYESGVGHIGGNLSCLDILMTLHHRVMQPNDVFILSKGHAAGALYVTLWTIGEIQEDELASFHRDGTRLSGHPPPNRIPRVHFATGSLGHGLSLASGVALGKRLRREPGRVYCLLSDGECQEGSTWEAVLFAAHQQLDLTMIIDANGLQGFGSTSEVGCLEPLAAKFRSFAWLGLEVDGHRPEAIIDACALPAEGPRAIVAHTVKGAGISFMENRVEWHYLPMSPEQYELAREENAAS